MVWRLSQMTDRRTLVVVTRIIKDHDNISRVVMDAADEVSKRVVVLALKVFYVEH
jgi:hypothetical protein